MLMQTLEDGRRLFDRDGLVDYIQSFLGDMALEHKNDPVATATATYTQKWLQDADFNDSERLDELLALYTMIFGDDVTTNDDEYFYAAAPEEVAAEGGDVEGAAGHMTG